MALNFPNSPTEGQIYTDTPSGNRWVWDSANTIWKSTSTFTQTITVSSTAPGTPVVGQLWWNQDYGRLLVYYSDGTSSQWVDASPSDYTSQLAYNTANAAFGKANTALQNTSGTFEGSLTATGQIKSTSSTGFLVQNSTSTGSNALRIINNSGSFYFGTENSAGTDYGLPAYSSFLYSNYSTPMCFVNNGSERMRITSGGLIGINTTAPQSQLAIVSNTSTAYVTTDNNYYASPYPHELTIQNNQQNTTNTFCGIFFQAGQTSFQSGINAGRLSFVRDGNNSYGGNFTFSNRTSSDATMREVMRIDQAGRVTKPYHPSFHVYDATGTDFASEAKNTNLTSVSWNNGSYYNTSTQRFTAPVAGYYYFYYRANMSNLRNPKQTVIYVNGSPKLRGYNWDTSTWSETAAIGIWYLAVNDYVEFYYQGDPDSGLTWNYAGGYLIG